MPGYFAIYDAATGEVACTITGGERVAALNTGPGQAWLEVDAPVKSDAQLLDVGQDPPVLVDRPPITFEIYDVETDEVVRTVTGTVRDAAMDANSGEGEAYRPAEE